MTPGSSNTITFAPRGDKKQIEEGTAFCPRFGEDGLIPVITTDAGTGEVLMMAYMNAEALRKTLELGEAVYWSRSRRELWHKGATSGLTQKVREMRTDCDQDVILLKVDSVGGACCHVGYRSCFYRRVEAPEGGQPALVVTEQSKAFDPNVVYGEKSRSK